jgi:ABC-type lipoprotein release transport system permease subunit
MRALVYGISPTDPLTLIAVALALVVIATLAGYIPARRAASIDPAEALR